jgi:hypothetical protein
MSLIPVARKLGYKVKIQSLPFIDPSPWLNLIAVGGFIINCIPRLYQSAIQLASLIKVNRPTSTLISVGLGQYFQSNTLPNVLGQIFNGVILGQSEGILGQM